MTGCKSWQGAEPGQNSITDAGGTAQALDGLTSDAAAGDQLSPGHLAVSGPGWLVVQAARQPLYSRADDFHVDERGGLVNAAGKVLQGRLADAAGRIESSRITDLVVGDGISRPRATTTVRVSANLDAQAPLAPAWDVARAASTSTFSLSAGIYDSLGQRHAYNLHFRKEAESMWRWYATLRGVELTDGDCGAKVVATGSLGFTSDGVLETETVEVFEFAFLGASQSQKVSFDFGTSVLTDAGDGLDGTTQFAVASRLVGEPQQDGFRRGKLLAVVVAWNGNVVGAYDNGQQQVLGQVVTAVFPDEGQLHDVGDGLFTATSGSGEPMLDAPEAAGHAARLLAARATTHVAIACNLSANADVPQPWDARAPGATSNFSHNLVVYDSLGEPHELTLYYRKVSAELWQWHLTLYDARTVAVGSGTLRFDASGKLIEETSTALALSFSGAAPNQLIELDFGTRGTALRASTRPTTQHPAASAHVELSQDGDSGGPGSGISMSGDALPLGAYPLVGDAQAASR